MCFSELAYMVFQNCPLGEKSRRIRYANGQAHKTCGPCSNCIDWLKNHGQWIRINMNTGKYVEKCEDRRMDRLFIAIIVDVSMITWAVKKITWAVVKMSQHAMSSSCVRKSNYCSGRERSKILRNPVATTCDWDTFMPDRVEQIETTRNIFIQKQNAEGRKCSTNIKNHHGAWWKFKFNRSWMP